MFCLATGAAMGLAWLLCRVLRQALGAGRIATALADVLCCLLCAGTVFLSALAVDKGRPRLYQLALQGLGGWAAYTALRPLGDRFSALLRKILRKNPKKGLK